MNFSIQIIPLGSGIDVLIVQHTNALLDQPDSIFTTKPLQFWCDQVTTYLVQAFGECGGKGAKQSKIFLIINYKIGNYCLDLTICQFYCWEGTYKRKLLRIRTHWQELSGWYFCEQPVGTRIGERAPMGTLPNQIQHPSCILVLPAGNKKG